MSRRNRFLVRLALLLLILFCAVPSDAARDAPLPPPPAGGPRDPAARGLDLFLHVPASGAPRAVLPLQVEALGFPTATTIAPLRHVTVEATWDPESLGPHVAVAPPSVQGTTDGAGRAHLEIPIPDGDERDLSLLVGVRSGEHQRTQQVKVRRVRPNDVAVYVANRRVVPGSTVSAWVLVTRAASGEPVASEPVNLELLEGGLSRFASQVTTDNAGIASLRVPIPRTTEPTWEWQLAARTLSAGFESGGSTVVLSPREETPGQPRVVAEWTDAEVLAGQTAAWTVRLRDATDAPVAGAEVRTWVGPRGTSPPDDIEEWEKVSQRALSSATGEVQGKADTPSTVVASVGTTLTLVARANVDGYDLHTEATLSVEAPASTAELFPEAGSIVPGVAQRMLVRVLGGDGNGVSAWFLLKADGLDTRVHTDAFGEAEVTWHPPRDVGAKRSVGPCAGGVAAAVVVRAEGAVPALGTRSEPFELCVNIDREADAIARVDSPLARAGDRVRVRLALPDDAPKSSVWSVVLQNDSNTQARSAWIDDAAKGVEIPVPEGASGMWTVSVAAPGDPKSARPPMHIGTSLLLRPRVLPKLVGRVVSGRIAPGGTVDVEATLGDGTGRPLVGAVSAVMIDIHGGGSFGGLDRIDTRSRLCGSANAPGYRCDAFLDGDAAQDPVRRAHLARRGAPLAPVNDPGGAMAEKLKTAFHDVIHSLEGAVFESTTSADQLRDVRRRGPNGWVFNPELLTLVTAAMDPKPTTPGGEPFSLSDSMAVDPQVTFDHVARRVTRLKLFRILSNVRQAKREQALVEGEPALREPNALLRRLVRDGRMEESLLLDPWGGTIQFVHTAEPPTPFLSVARGFALHAPGPNGVVGDADDVNDPFERVLASKSPYANASDEDRLVDARYDMEVGDATVSAWSSLLEMVTGTALGSGGLGLSGTGEGGGGMGYGHGLGNIGTIGHGRGTSGVPTDVQYWSPPVRTDANGKVVLHVPLGDIETTWRIALIAIPDGAMPATATVDVPVALPLSARVDAGAVWVAGDILETRITLRNRTGQPARTQITVQASGAASLVDPTHASRAVDVPAGGAAVVGARVRANGAGIAELTVTTRAAGLPEDVVRHRWEVRAPGEDLDLIHVQWVSGKADLGAWLDRRGFQPLGAARLEVEDASDGVLPSALEALDPDNPMSPSALADAVETAARLHAWALPRRGERDPLVLRAAEIAHRGVGRLAAYHKAAKEGPEVHWWTLARARAFAIGKDAEALAKGSDCPPPHEPNRLESPLALADSLDAEPPTTGGAVAACWDTYVSNVMEVIESSRNAPALARALLALAERPHRAAQASGAAERLRHHALPGEAGALVVAAPLDRASRALVYAGLVRAATMDRGKAATLPGLVAWMLVQRDARGGFGSPAATRAAVRALLGVPAFSEEARGTLAVVTDDATRTAELGRTPIKLPIPLGTRRLELEVRGTKDTGPGVVTRLVRPVLRPWSAPPPDPGESPVHVEVTWPKASAGKSAALILRMRHELSHEVTLEADLPLPPGVTLAGPITGIRQVQGKLLVRRRVDAGDVPVVVESPLRFAFPGRVTVPEGTVRVVEEDLPTARVPARPLRIE